MLSLIFLMNEKFFISFLFNNEIIIFILIKQTKFSHKFILIKQTKFSHESKTNSYNYVFTYILKLESFIKYIYLTLFFLKNIIVLFINQIYQSNVKKLKLKTLKSWILDSSVWFDEVAACNYEIRISLDQVLVAIDVIPVTNQIILASINQILVS